MHTLYKPNGREVEVNDQSLKASLDLGWTKKDPTKKETAVQKKKREAAESLAAKALSAEKSK